MRMNELIAGVRADVAIKLFGDDLDQLLETGQAVEEVAGGIVGAQDVKLEQVTGLPMLSDTPDRDKLARYGVRSEEHTSELQSLMRISYAVFGLQKNNKKYKESN